MLPKAHLTSHSRMSGSRWVITPSWLSGSWRSFLYSSSVYSCHLFLISSACYTISVLYCAHLCMKRSLGISNFLEEITSLPHSIVFHLFLALLARWWNRRTCAHLLLRELQNCNSLLNNHLQDNVGSHQKKIPDIQGQRRSPSKTVEGAKSHLESNPRPTRDARRAQTKPCAHTRRPHRDWDRPAFECFYVSCGGMGQQWPDAGAGALGAADLGMA